MPLLFSGYNVSLVLPRRRGQPFDSAQRQTNTYFCFLVTQVRPFWQFRGLRAELAAWRNA